MNVSALKAAGYEWIMHEMIRINKKIDRLTAENEDLKKALKAKDKLLKKSLAMLLKYFHRHGALYEYTPTEIAKHLLELEQALKGTDELDKSKS